MPNSYDFPKSNFLIGRTNEITSLDALTTKPESGCFVESIGLVSREYKYAHRTSQIQTTR